MARETVYIVQAYVAGRGKALKAEPQVGCKSAEEARRKAERLAPLRLGVVAFAASAVCRDGRLRRQPRDPVQGWRTAAALERELSARAKSRVARVA